MNPVNDLDLDDLRQGMGALTPAVGAFYAEAAAACLANQNHPSPVELELHVPQSQLTARVMLTWQDFDGRMRDAWRDLDEAVEYGACGVAVLVVRELKGLLVASRSAKGTGFDFWLGNGSSGESGGLLLQNKFRLEVSGIRKGSKPLISKRIKQKLKQTEQSAGCFPAIVVIIEFRKPQSHVEEL